MAMSFALSYSDSRQSDLCILQMCMSGVPQQVIRLLPRLMHGCIVFLFSSAVFDNSAVLIDHYSFNFLKYDYR